MGEQRQRVEERHRREGGHRGKIFHVCPEKRRQSQQRHAAVRKSNGKQGCVYLCILVGMMMMISGGMFWLLHNGVGGPWSVAAEGRERESGGQRFTKSSNGRRQKERSRRRHLSEEFRRPPPVSGNLRHSYSNPLAPPLPALIPQ